MNRRGDQTLPRPPTGLHLGWFAHRHHERQLQMYRPDFEEVKGQFTWERALEPHLS